MKKIFLISVLLVTIAGQAMSQGNKRDIDENYRRSSLYSLMVSHTNSKFNKEIEQCFLKIPTPDAYNDHDLSVKVVSINRKRLGKPRNNENGITEINEFLDRNKVASRLVANGMTTIHIPATWTLI